jgi:hypothetical protein
MSIHCTWCKIQNTGLPYRPIVITYVVIYFNGVNEDRMQSNVSTIIWKIGNLILSKKRGPRTQYDYEYQSNHHSPTWLSHQHGGTIPHSSHDRTTYAHKTITNSLALIRTSLGKRMNGTILRSDPSPSVQKRDSPTLQSLSARGSLFEQQSNSALIWCGLRQLAES